MGLINQTTTFTDKIAEMANPLKSLLKKKVDYVWTGDHQEAFEKARTELADVRQLAYFDHRRPTRLYTDASRLNGLGFVVKQLQPDDQTWKIVQARSRFLSSAETRYAMVELELLAIAWACEKARPFLEGIQFEIYTDHRPLIPILNDYALSEIENKRLQRLKMKLSCFTYKALWIDGKSNQEADALSRAPVDQPTKEDEIDEQFEEVKTSIEALISLNEVSTEPDFSYVDVLEMEIADKLAEEVRDAGEQDEDYKLVRTWLMTKYQPNPEAVSSSVHPYYKNLDRFSLDSNNLLCYDDKIVIPKPLRSKYLDRLIHLHASPEKMKSRARKSIWWPFMASDIDNRWRSCRTCLERSPSNAKEPSFPREPCTYPFQRLHMDLGAYSGKQFLIMVDQFSLWPIAKNLGRDTTTTMITDMLLKLFETFGLPEEIISDGGPQFTSNEFDQFCKDWTIKHTTSSPHHPQSNGIAENAVKAMKRIIHCTFDAKRGCVDPKEWVRALTLYKNTPRGRSNLSPSEILFGKLLRDGIVADKDQYQADHQAAIQRRRDEVEEYFSNLNRIDKEPIFRKGDLIALQNPQTKRWEDKATIVQKGNNRREWFVETESGTRYRRNRKFFKHLDVRKNRGGSIYRERLAGVQPKSKPDPEVVVEPEPDVVKPKPAMKRISFGGERKEETKRRSNRHSKPPERFQAGSKK